MGTVQGAMPSMIANKESSKGKKKKKRSRIQVNRMSFENNKLSIKEQGGTKKTYGN